MDCINDYIIEGLPRKPIEVDIDNFYNEFLKFLVNDSYKTGIWYKINGLKTPQNDESPTLRVKKRSSNLDLKN